MAPLPRADEDPHYMIVLSIKQQTQKIMLTSLIKEACYYTNRLSDYKCEHCEKFGVCNEIGRPGDLHPALALCSI